MAYNEPFAQRVRQALSPLPDVEEKRMFGGLAFMVDKKMCVTVGADRMMFRINPVLHEEAVSKPGCSTVSMGGRQYKGYVHVATTNLANEDDFAYWLRLALDYNKIAKASRK
ncbi:TfoX family protein [Segetibacter sp. 3557_3]|uniref:TfoX/Sxy family protein n=1 Tax=Segetibacter sp. 3557_3 TaxID=2547429 RepID=UPI001058443E|nr:TfoX/Sxy family protein [Segetibacter sp. 3557_3]TDH28577.1 TfoX family protein [Segetibacter sp. 3557_3]